jgi:hypothetical protein
MTDTPVPDYTLSFWHPVGPHAGESLQAILVRKQQDIAQYGFALWSFAPARDARVVAWRHELLLHEQKTCWVLCSGKNCRDPHQGGAVIWAHEYSSDLQTWRAVPHPQMTSYHRAPSSNGILACAFMVNKLEQPPDMNIPRPRSWYRTADRCWTQDPPVPTRGQYLVRLSQTDNGVQQHIHCLLETTAPFVVWLR